jgi:hypothetical protein
MTICVKPFRGNTGIGTTKTSYSTSRTSAPITNPAIKSPDWRPVNPIKWDFPTVIKNPNIIAHTINFEDRRITWTIQYDATPDTQTGDKCPENIKNKFGLLGSEYPFNKQTKKTKVLSVDCETSPDVFAAFTHHGESGINLLTVPKSYTGKYAETFFIDYFINDITPNVTLPDAYQCLTEVPLCIEPDSMLRNVPISGLDVALRSIIVDEDRLQYNLLINGAPASMQGTRYDDNIPIGADAPILNIPSLGLHPLLQESLSNLEDAVAAASSKSPFGKGDGDAADQTPPSGSAEDKADSPVCGGTNSVTFSDILPLLTFNYSFFPERILDLFLNIIWRIFEFLLWIFFNILPVCEVEWQIAADKLKAIFTFNGQDCTPPFINKLSDQMVKFFGKATCCNVKELLKYILLGQWQKALPLFIRCVVYWIICFYRRVLHYFLLLLMSVSRYIINIILYGSDCACAFVKTGSLTDCVPQVDLDISRMNESTSGSDNQVGL